VLRRDESLADEFMSSQHIGIDRRRISAASTSSPAANRSGPEEMGRANQSGEH
jgi:hypothetical protein